MSDKQITANTRIAVSVCLFISLGGCAEVQVVEPANEEISPESSVVAFSVNTSTMEGSAVKEYGARFRASHLSLKGYGTIRLTDGDSGLKTLVLEPAGEALEFGRFSLSRGGAGKQYEFETIAAGPRIKLTPGAITYLGRLEIEDIQFHKRANWTTDTPSGIKLQFRDASEDDFRFMQDQYEIFRDRTVVRQIIGRWGELEYEAVRFVRTTSTPLSDSSSH